MYRDHFLELYDYTAWANRRVWDCVLRLSDERYFQPLEYSVGSIFAQCLHTAAVEQWWGDFLRTGELLFLDDDNIEELRPREALAAYWDDVATRNRTFIASLNEADFRRKVKPAFWEAEEPAITVAQALTQVANHSTDHRAQILAMLYSLGAITTDQDFLAYLHRDVE
jgi:uncharacterized damage-inducible protein DinB